MTKLSIRGISLNVEIMGRGYPLALFHGGPGLDYQTMLPLQSLADQFTLIFFDHRCNGRSEGAEVSSMNWENLTADADALREKLVGACVCVCVTDSPWCTWRMPPGAQGLGTARQHSGEVWGSNSAPICLHTHQGEMILHGGPHQQMGPAHTPPPRLATVRLLPSAQEQGGMLTTTTTTTSTPRRHTPLHHSSHPSHLFFTSVISHHTGK